MGYVVASRKMELQTFTCFFLAFVVLTDGAPRDPIVGGWEPLDPESELGKEAVNLALEHYQKSVEPDHHVKHIWLAEMQLVSGTNYHLILTLEEADSSSSDEDEDDDKETKSDTCDYKIYKPIQGSPKITSKCLSDL